MKNKVVSLIILSISLPLSVFTYGFTSTNSIEGSEDKKDPVTLRFEEMDRKFGITPEYNWEQDQRKIGGEDTNGDGIRDALIKITKSFVFPLKDVTKEQFDELYSLAIAIQPPEPNPHYKFQRNKSEKQFQCQYAKISRSIGLDAPYKEFRNTIIFGSNKRSAYWHTIKPIKTDNFECDIDFDFEN